MAQKNFSLPMDLFKKNRFVDKNQFKIFGNHPFEILEFLTSTVLWFLLTLLLLFRYLKSNHFPLANFYEALIFLTWCLVTLNFFLVFGTASMSSNTKTKSILNVEYGKNFFSAPKNSPEKVAHDFNSGQPSLQFFGTLNNIYDQFLYRAHFASKPQKKIYGGILAPCILFIIAFAQFNLSSEFSPLVPALKSNWLLMHVSIMIFSYTIFIVAGLISFILIIQKYYQSFEFFLRSKKISNNFNYTNFQNTGFYNILTNRTNSITNPIKDSYQKLEISPSIEFLRTSHFRALPIGLTDSLSTGKALEKPQSLSHQSENQKKYQLTSMNIAEIKKNCNIGILQNRNQINFFLDYTRNSAIYFLPELLEKIQKRIQITQKKKLRERALSELLAPIKRRKDRKRSFLIENLLPERFISRKNTGQTPDENRKIVDFKIASLTNQDKIYLKTNYSNFTSDSQIKHNDIPTKISQQMQKNYFSITLDQISYRLFGIGFPLFTLGILSGAVWANSAWGSYWSWDIKETGSFINWLTIAFYLHCRYKNFISLSHVIGFLSIIFLFFNFFGISLGIFGSSLHAYGAAS